MPDIIVTHHCASGEGALRRGERVGWERLSASLSKLHGGSGESRPQLSLTQISRVGYV